MINKESREPGIDEREYIPHNIINAIVIVQIKPIKDLDKFWRNIRGLARRFGGDLTHSHIRKVIHKSPFKMEFSFVQKMNQAKKFADLLKTHSGIVDSTKVYSQNGYLIHMGGEHTLEEINEQYEFILSNKGPQFECPLCEEEYDEDEALWCEWCDAKLCSRCMQNHLVDCEYCGRTICTDSIRIHYAECSNCLNCEWCGDLVGVDDAERCEECGYEKSFCCYHCLNAHILEVHPKELEEEINESKKLSLYDIFQEISSLGDMAIPMMPFGTQPDRAKYTNKRIKAQNNFNKKSKTAKPDKRHLKRMLGDISGKNWIRSATHGKTKEI